MAAQVWALKARGWVKSDGRWEERCAEMHPSFYLSPHWLFAASRLHFLSVSLRVFPLVSSHLSVLPPKYLSPILPTSSSLSTTRIVWEGADPYTASDMCALDRHCRQRGIALVPNQNSLGHFHRFLKHDRYSAQCIVH